MTTEKIPSPGYRWVILGILWLVHLIGFMNIAGLGILAPFLQSELHLTSTQIGFLISAVSLGSCLTQVPLGLIIDQFGVRFILPLSTTLLGLLLAGFSFLTSYTAALVLLLCYGLVNGAVSPAASKGVMDWFPPIGRATAMGLKQTGVNIGGILAGLLLPFLSFHFTWRRGLLLLSLAEVACAVLMFKWLKESPVHRSGPSFSVEWQKIRKMALNRPVLLLGAVVFFFLSTQFCFSAYLTLFLTRRLDYSVTQAGYFFAAAYLAGGVARVPWSLVSDYYLRGRRKGVLLMIAWIELFSLVALVLISFTPAASTPLLVVTILCFGISGIGWNAILLTLLGESVGRESAALGTGTGFFFGFLGALVSPPLFGYLVDRTGGFGFSWLFLAFCLVAIILLLHHFPERKERIEKNFRQNH